MGGVVCVGVKVCHGVLHGWRGVFGGGVWVLHEWRGACVCEGVAWVEWCVWV